MINEELYNEFTNEWNTFNSWINPFGEVTLCIVSETIRAKKPLKNTWFAQVDNITVHNLTETIGFNHDDTLRVTY